MYYFVPSWYSIEYQWHANDMQWYKQKNLYEFDDTVNQVRMFRNAGKPVQLVVLSYAPNLRHFLHRQNLLSVPVWSAFDRMQAIDLEAPGLIFYRDLPWPTETQWYYTPYQQLAYVNGEKIASVDFGEDGNLLWVNYYRNGEMDHRDVYDDRGFLSSRVLCRNGKPHSQEYYDMDGTPQFSENLETGAVTIRKTCHFHFSRSFYNYMQDAMEEIMADYFLLDADRGGTVIIASNEQHNDLLLRAVRGQNVILSFFEDRFDLDNSYRLVRDVERAKMVVTDTERASKVIRDNIRAELEHDMHRNDGGNLARDGGADRLLNMPVYDISPFDTRLSLGESQRIRKLKIFMPIDGMDRYYFERGLVQILFYMTKNEAVELHIGIQSSDQHEIETAQDEVRRIVGNTGFPIMVNGFEEGAAEPRVFIRPFVTETDLIRILRDIRLIVDVRDQPNLYLQIAGISSGIPQVNYRFTRYVVDREDGYIIQNINHVLDALEYYLSGLENWNRALIFCVQEIRKYSSGELVTRWEELMRQAGIREDDNWTVI